MTSVTDDGPTLNTAGLDDALPAWWDQQDLTDEQKAIKNIHRHMRDHAGIGKGTRTDYVQALNEILIDGEDPAAVSNGEAAFKMAKQHLNCIHCERLAEESRGEVRRD